VPCFVDGAKDGTEYMTILWHCNIPRILGLGKRLRPIANKLIVKYSTQ
jgi:hypothetical protein